jgi:hypothetical protein
MFLRLMISCGAGEISGTISLFAGFFFQLNHRPADNSLAFDLRMAILRWDMCLKV